MDEFSMIETLFRPVTLGDRAALSLTDDAALLDLPIGAQQVVTCDALVAGVHFFADDPPDRDETGAYRINFRGKGWKKIGYESD